MEKGWWHGGGLGAGPHLSYVKMARGALLMGGRPFTDLSRARGKQSFVSRINSQLVVNAREISKSGIVK